MNKPLPTPRELEALKVLWERGACTVREIYDGMSGEREGIAYTTVLSLIQTMEKKGLVHRDTEGRGRSHRYSATPQAEPTLQRLAADFLDTVFEGALGQYLVSALEAKATSMEEIEEMEQMLANAKKRLGKKRNRGTDSDS